MSGNSNCTSVADQDFLTGKLLIAMPNMGDPRFEKAVVFMCAHDGDHAMGIIVNKRVEDLALTQLLEQLDIEPSTQASQTPVFFGGPVQTERGLVVHTLDYAVAATVAVTPNIGITATREILEDIGGPLTAQPPPDKYLLAIGHAGWGPGQLEQELAMNAWIHCNVDESIIFKGAETPAWNNALKKLGVSSEMLSSEWAEIRSSDKPLN